MKAYSHVGGLIVILSGLLLSATSFANENKYVFTAGHPSLKEWLLPDMAPYPEGNKPNKVRISLGEKLFFDPRLSGDGNMSCATCHNPSLGWSDGQKTAKGVKSKVLDRASPTIFNAAFNSIQMWDGRKKSLEEQAIGPMEATVEMNMDTKKLFMWLNSNKEYIKLFSKAYPSEEIAAPTVSKALATYERTIISNNSNFDRWVKGEKKAMTSQQVQGFKIFTGKAKCIVCHSAPNFTDNGFHNIGLASWGEKEPDMGRYFQRPLRLMKGAFKTPSLREIKRTAPYFHDGSAKTLKEVVEHYVIGGVVKTNLSPNMEKIDLSDKEINDVVEFMKALSSPFYAVSLPELPID
jgi:cytochrome c peroxidase